MINVGIIGLGHMGILHLMNCRHIDGVKVVAVADKSKGALKKAELFGVKAFFTDYQDLLKGPPKVDTVIIALPNFMHFESIQSALEAGVDVFVEKPLANTVEECEKIIKLVEKSGRKLMVGHNMRFIEAVAKMKGAIDRGHIGDVEAITLEQILNGPFAHGAIPRPVAEWWFDPKRAGGGVLLDLGYHMLDLFRFFVGEDPEVIFSYLSYKFNLPTEDGAIVILRSPVSGARGIVNVGWFQKSVFPEYNFRVVLHGCAGFISSENLTPRNIYFHAIKEGTKNILRKTFGRKIKPLSWSYYYEAYYKELQSFFSCVRNDSEPPVSAVDGLKTVELIEKVYKKFGKKEPRRDV
ncbi:MAG: Gfo/Idh/MocA family oxidoreductase [Candidatus Bathyarchaeia archaeon]